MSEQIIECPNCHTQIPLNDALTQKIQHQLESQMKAEMAKKEKALLQKQQQLESEKKNITTEVAKKLEAEKHRIWKIAQEKASEKLTLEMEDLQKGNKEKEVQLTKMREQEMLLRKQKREEEEKTKNMALELERKMDEERKSIIEQAQKDASTEIHLKMKEKEKQLEQMHRTIEDLKRKSEQGSMQIQGDAQEEDLKNILQQTFLHDTIADVPTGVRGADLVHTVQNPLGQQSGIILWESKNTKTWNKSWVSKLKDDQSLVKADVCILITQALPEGITDFGYQDGVWICKYSFALSLANILRLHLIHVGQVKQSLVGKDQKMELLYHYLSGNEFKNRVENIVLAFTTMKSDLETEKRSFQRIWNKREKEIERVIMSTSGMYGDLQGIVGGSLATIPSLELPDGESEQSDRQKNTRE